jgi:hypothetical protein
LRDGIAGADRPHCRRSESLSAPTDPQCGGKGFSRAADTPTCPEHEDFAVGIKGTRRQVFFFFFMPPPTEIDVDPLGVRVMTGPERAAMIARLLDDHPELAELVPERLRVVGK